MNRLVDRIEALLERERAGVADLSHRLRTPITALRLRIDALPDADDRARLAETSTSSRPWSTTSCARPAAPSARAWSPASDAVAVLAERARFWAPLAEDQGRPFEVRVDPSRPVLVPASEEDLRALVDVLLDNVFTHTPDGTRVAVSLAARPRAGLRLTVDDGGPGLPGGG